ncbi:hypothetical protein MOQ_001552 [Trypanosoma cruzi marinkellei]|uniref:Uncharacterized protein n=1 Tax=Trypanosoma cruzi marinkellei TaxID=85056 RepID=K2NG00_TRYCR|nr:hypothetical protein MOQ_001552 [Trypanosoma cruzi marinkellei]
MVTSIGEKKARGLSECIAVACERRRGGVPHRTVPIGISTAFDTVDDGRSLAVLGGLPRLRRRAQRRLRNHLRGGRVGVTAREQYSRQRLVSAVAAQRGVLGPQLPLYCVDGLLRRLDNIRFASAFLRTDVLTLVASGAESRACAVAVPTAACIVATWAAEPSLKINAYGSGAALFRIASHRQCDGDAADHRLGSGNPRVTSHPSRQLGNAINRHLNFILHVTAAAGQTVSRRRQLRLGTGAWGVPAHHAFSFWSDVSKGASQHGGEVIAPSPAPSHLHSLEARKCDSCASLLGPRASAKDAPLHLAAGPAPLQKIVGSRGPTQHERATRPRCIEDVRGMICSETTPSSIIGKAATTIPLPRYSVVNKLRRVRSHMRISPHHIRTPHAEHRIDAWDTVSCSGVGVFQPRHVNDAPDDLR